MQQINGNVVMISPGDAYDERFEDYLKIYLSGSLDLGGKSTPWQQKFINGLSKLTVKHPNKPELPDYTGFKFLVFNPLVPVNGEPSVDNPEFVQKLNWELEMMERSDVIFCNFLKKSVLISAISGYLLNAQTGKVICRCPIECNFYPQVKVLSDKYGIPLLGNSGSLIDAMKTMFEFIPKFKELANFSL